MNNTVYKGAYKKDLKHGEAIIWNLGIIKSDIIFKGEYILGKMHGKCFVQDENHKFDGYVDKGRYHGPCKIVYSNGNIYQGTMVNGNISGQGKIIYNNGDTYEGGFLNNVRTGEGNYKWFLNNVTVNFSSDLSVNHRKNSRNKNMQLGKIQKTNRIINHKK